MTPATVRVPIRKVDGPFTRLRENILAVEEPLEIRIGSRSVSVTMRTPGYDFEPGDRLSMCRRHHQQRKSNSRDDEFGPNIPLLAAVGAHSSLAVATAECCGMTLIGFLGNGSVYSGTACSAGLERSKETFCVFG